MICRLAAEYNPSFVKFRRHNQVPKYSTATKQFYCDIYAFEIPDFIKKVLRKSFQYMPNSAELRYAFIKKSLLNMPKF